MSASEAPRVRRPIAERFRDFVHEEYPLDRTGDQRIDELLDQLKNERDSRAEQGRPGHAR